LHQLWAEIRYQHILDPRSHDLRAGNNDFTPCKPCISTHSQSSFCGTCVVKGAGANAVCISRFLARFSLMRASIPADFDPLLRSRGSDEVTIFRPRCPGRLREIRRTCTTRKGGSNICFQTIWAIRCTENPDDTVWMCTGDHRIQDYDTWQPVLYWISIGKLGNRYSLLLNKKHTRMTMLCVILLRVRKHVENRIFTSASTHQQRRKYRSEHKREGRVRMRSGLIRADGAPPVLSGRDTANIRVSSSNSLIVVRCTVWSMMAVQRRVCI
jgi:hypothetical protein